MQIFLAVHGCLQAGNGLSGNYETDWYWPVINKARKKDVLNQIDANKQALEGISAFQKVT